MEPVGLLPWYKTDHKFFLFWVRNIQFTTSYPIFNTHFNIILPSTPRIPACG